jgi:hypothetical protein
MESLMRRLILMLALPLAACEPEPTALRFGDDHVVVHAVLEAGAAEARVLVERMTDSGVTVEPVQLGPIAGALVEIEGDGAVVRLSPADRARVCHNRWTAEQTPYPGCYVAQLPRPVQPGVEYRLHVRLPSGEVITGATTVPAIAAIASPDTSAVFEVPGRPVGTITTQSLSVAWHGVPARGRAELRVIADVQGCDLTIRPVVEWNDLSPFGGYLWIDVTGTDSLEIAGYFLACGQTPFTHGPGRILLSAYDENFARYIRMTAGNARPLAEAAVGITGAFGVFGSVATASRPIEIVTR